MLHKNEQIETWKHFAKKVRSRGCNLLSNLSQYSDTIFVAGCQRSGTTAVANIITASDGMINYWTGKDSELDAALLLSGHSSYKKNGRYCFQTTYLPSTFRPFSASNSCSEKPSETDLASLKI